MIVLITFIEDGELLVSHGIDQDTLKTICLPTEHPSRLGAKFNTDIGEWVIYDK